MKAKELIGWTTSTGIILLLDDAEGEETSFSMTVEQAVELAADLKRIFIERQGDDISAQAE